MNFLKLLRAPHEEYVWGEDALMYAEFQGLSLALRARLTSAAGKGDRILVRRQSLGAATGRLGNPRRRTAADRHRSGLVRHADALRVVRRPAADERRRRAVQDFGMLHALCWLHAERSIRKLVPLEPAGTRGDRGRPRRGVEVLPASAGYRESPTPQRKAALERDFERLFRRRTGFADLNEALRRIHEKRDDLLLVLERPEIPLHNNLSESDIREWAKKRKISAGTRSELGRRCRDTFVSLKKTCRKLGVSFWRYLQDRIRGAHEILALPELMRQAAQET